MDGHFDRHPTPKDVIREAIGAMLEREEDLPCRFDDADSSAWVEVARSGRDLQIKLSYPHRDGFAGVLIEQGTLVPDRWRLVRFRRKSFLFPGQLTYLAPQEDLDRVVAFIDNYFADTCLKGRTYALLESVRS